MSTEESKEEVEVQEPEINESDQYKDKYFRLLAEMENLRKRMSKEGGDNTKHAVGNVIAEFLHPIDNLESALNYADKMSDEVKNWAIGFKMILNQFQETLGNYGVKPIDTQGQHFDPHLHDAIEMRETSEFEPGAIVEECRKGYVMGERTIRPARVVVAKTPVETSQSKEQEPVSE